jgi:RHS repeat-associated protein
LQRVKFLYDGFNPVEETLGASLGTNILTGLGIDEYFTRTEMPAGSPRYFLSDALGSAVSLVDAAGVSQTEYAYEPFGKTAATGESNTNSFEFTGRENDGTGLYYYRARYYHPGLQRFISEDPIGYAGGDINLFAYASNSPTNFRDPSGKFVPMAVVGATLCATGAVTGAAAYQALSGRKSTFLGFLAGAAVGCVGGIGLGSLVGLAVEWAFPTLMAAGGEVQLWAGVSATVASVEAATYGRALVGSTFSGSAIRLAQSYGILSDKTAYGIMQSLSANFVSGASSASVLLGPSVDAAKTFFTYELPVLESTGASIMIQYIR